MPTHRKSPIAAALATAFAMLAAACSGGDAEPTAFPEPTATATATVVRTGATAAATPAPGQTPTPTATPAAPVVVTPEGFLTYQNNTQGFSISYPDDWTEAELPEGAPFVRILGPGGPPAAPVIDVFSYFEEEDLPLSERVQTVADQFMAALTDATFEPGRTLSLDDGTPAYQAELRYAQQGLDTVTLLLAVARKSQTFMVIVTATQGAFDRAADDIAQSLATIAVFSPSPFGIARERALTMAWADPVTLDPAMSRESQSHMFVAQLFSGLVHFDEDLRLQLDLAEDVQTDASGTVYTFMLREGIVFHDGTPITAEDVRYSIERAADPALLSDTASAYLGDILGVSEKLAGEADSVRGVEVLGPRTIRITTDAPKGYFLAKLTYPTAAVVDRRNVEEGGLEWWRTPNGSGPFKLREWTEREVLVLERFDGYVPGPSTLEFAVFPILAGVPVRMYEADQVDIASIGGSDIDRALDPASGFAGELTIFPQFTSFYVGFNTRIAPFDDPVIRRAFVMAVDRDQLVQVVFEGDVAVAQGILPPGLPGYTETLAAIPFDPEGALRLIETSSYGSVDALPPIVYTTSGLGGIAGSLSFLLESWRENLGVEVEVRQLEPDAYFYQLADEVDNLYNYGWVADFPDPQNFLDILFHSESIENNIGRYTSAEFDALVEEARTEQDTAKRFALYAQAEQLLLDDAAAIPLYHGREYTLIKPYVKNFVFSPLGVPELQRVVLEPRDVAQ